MMRRVLINAAVVVVLLSAPIFLGSLLWGFALLYEVVPLWVWAVQCASGMIIALGLAALLDKRSPLPPHLPADR